MLFPAVIACHPSRSKPQPRVIGEREWGDIARGKRDGATRWRHPLAVGPAPPAARLKIRGG
jgi:hypothetical protein